MKKCIVVALSSIGLAMAAPAHAQQPDEQTESQTESSAKNDAKEIEAFTQIFSSVFQEDETPIAPELLARGERVAAAVVPQGSYREIIAETLQTIVEPMMAGLEEMPLSAVATFAGVPEEEITIKEGANMGDLMMIIDPYFKERNRAMMSSMTEIMIDLSDDVEPLIRAGMARAYARRFSADELDGVATFFETKTGAKFAGESLSIFASREVMSASMEIMPKFMEKLFGQMEDITGGKGDIPPPRKFEELSDEELDKLAELMGVPREELKGSPFGISAGSFGDDDAAEIAAAAAEAAAEDWSDPESWSPEERAQVDQFEAEYDAAFDRWYDAMEAAKANARTRMEKETK